VAADRKPLRERARGLFRTQFTCCGRTWRGHRAMNAHHIARHSGMWMSKKARQAARSMGKDWDQARRHAMGWLRASGLRDQRGQHTPKSRARPQGGGRLTMSRLREMHQHDRDSQRTDRRAGRLERRAASAAARGQHGRADAHRARVADERMAHHQRWPERTRSR
jgi:hypothetical protein